MTLVSSSSSSSSRHSSPPPTVIILLLTVIFSIQCDRTYFFGAASAATTTLLTATEQALGQWDVTLKIRGRDKQWNRSVLFPKQQSEQRRRSESRRGLLPPSGHDAVPRDGPVVLRCLLTLKNDGTFEMIPRPSSSSTNNDDKRRERTHPSPSLFFNKRRRRDDANNVLRRPPPHDDVLALSGQWNVRPNPYCVTDRHFDELDLLSRPRARAWSRRRRGRFAPSPAPLPRRRHSHRHGSQLRNEPTLRRKFGEDVDDDGRAAAAAARTAVLIERVRIELRCQVWGRYGSRSLRRLFGPWGGSGGDGDGRERSRLTRGTVLAVRSGSKSLIGNGSYCPKWAWWRRRVVVATFRASAVTTDLKNDVAGLGTCF